MSGESTRGSFTWYDLMTTDPEAAKAFYTAVVGWGTTTWDGPAPYTMWTAGGTPLGGSMRLPEEAVAQGAKPHWLAYVAVPDVDATMARAKELGATIMVQPTDIPSTGRYAVFADPQGAILGVFKSEKEGPAPAGEPAVGEFSWHELTTKDHAAAFAFYSDLFGWEKMAEHDMGPMGIYLLYGRNGRQLGGMFSSSEYPTAWLHYARVEDVHRAAETIREKGGQIANGPMEVPGGDWIVAGIDPQGGMFAVHQKGGGAQA
jgi:predicted enzyme related to lactoylglutathione lyase